MYKSTEKPELLLIWGTRPEALKWKYWVSWRRSPFNLVCLHTRQHYDQNMLGRAYNGILAKHPHHIHYQFTGSLQSQEELNSYLDGILLKHPIRAVLVWGDTHSALWGALWANSKKIPLVHLEAGMRSHLLNQTEEGIRRRIDALTQLYICPHKSSQDELIKEGWLEQPTDSRALILPDMIYWSLPRTSQRPANPPTASILATLHRRETIQHPETLRYWVQSLETLAQSCAITWVLHPHTQECLRQHQIPLPKGIALLPPLGQRRFFDLLHKHTLFITDSGGAFVESVISGTPVCCFRPATEWHWLLKTNSAELSPPDHRSLVKQALRLLAQEQIQPKPFPSPVPSLRRLADFLLRNLK